MNDRLTLHSELLKFLPNVYFQPPANITMRYPAIVYNKTDKFRQFGNDGVYIRKQEYQLTVIENNPDSDVAEKIEDHFQYCVINQYLNADNLNQTHLKLYY